MKRFRHPATDSASVLNPSVSKPTVSVAMAAYNGAAFIGEQLASIAEQTSLPTEIVVSDDGSTDGTQAIVARFAASAPFEVRLLQKDRKLGILNNFWSAFEACRGEVIFYCDQDDVWRREKVAWQLQAIARGAVLAVHPSEIVDAALVSSGRIEPMNRATGHLETPVDFTQLRSFGHQMAFRRPVFEVMTRMRTVTDRISRTELGTNFDRYIPFCASLVGPIAVLTEPMTRFRRHAAATTQAGSSSTPLVPGARAAALIASERASMRDAREIVSAAGALGLLDATALGLYEKALARRMALLDRQESLACACGLSRCLALPAALAASVHATGFSNDSRIRALKVSLAAMLAWGALAHRLSGRHE